MTTCKAYPHEPFEEGDDILKSIEQRVKLLIDHPEPNSSYQYKLYYQYTSLMYFLMQVEVENESVLWLFQNHDRDIPLKFLEEQIILIAEAINKQCGQVFEFEGVGRFRLYPSSKWKKEMISVGRILRNKTIICSICPFNHEKDSENPQDILPCSNTIMTRHNYRVYANMTECPLGEKYQLECMERKCGEKATRKYLEDREEFLKNRPIPTNNQEL